MLRRCSGKAQRNSAGQGDPPGSLLFTESDGDKADRLADVGVLRVADRTADRACQPGGKRCG
jgi:hypothetical protein